MSENKMAEVAKMFGKKPGEGFLVKSVGGKIVKCMFGDESLWYADIDGEYVSAFFVSDTLLRQLITGEAVIVDAETH
jgi:hypothetical protein